MMITYSYMISFILFFVSYICKQEVIILYHYYLFIIIIYNETYHVNKGVIVSISNIAFIIPWHCLNLIIKKINIYIYIYSRSSVTQHADNSTLPITHHPQNIWLYSYLLHVNKNPIIQQI